MFESIQCQLFFKINIYRCKQKILLLKYYSGGLAISMKNRIYLFLILFLLPTAAFSLTYADALIRAVESNDLPAVRTLLEKGADVNFLTEDGKTPLICAVLRENTEMVYFLLEHGAAPDFCAPGTLSPVRVARLRNLKDIEALLSRNEYSRQEKLPDINLADMIRENRTADFLSALAKNPQLANRSSAEGDTPLMYAAYWGKTVYTKALLEYGADPNAKDTDGYTPLHLAAAKGHFQTVKILLQKKAAVNETTKDGMTPLMLAAKGGHDQTARLLIACGADWSKRSGEDLTFFDYALTGLIR